MTKQKNSQKFVTAIIIGLFTCLLIALGSLMLAFALPSQGTYESQSQATAEILEQVPYQQPPFLQINHDCRDEALHCFWVNSEAIRAETVNEVRELSSTLVISVDGRVRQDITPLLIDGRLYVDLGLSQFGAGLHLIEVQIQDEDGRIYQHMWAERSETGAISAPATLAIPPTYSTTVPDNDD